MNRPQTWFLDFDETLASGGITWALQDAFPKFIQDNALTYDAGELRQVMLLLQELASQNPDPSPLLDLLFERMKWPHQLQHQFYNDLITNYRPALFDDTLPFLERLRQNNYRVYIVSNNIHTPEQVNLLGLQEYFDGVFTPHLCPGTRPKPDSSLWKYMAAQEAGIDPHTSVIVGDDPWSDGAFAENCGLKCWIVDRMNRFPEMYTQKPYQWVHSLREITI